MITSLNRLPKSIIELTITIPWTAVKEQFDKTISELGKEMELPGFRKGKAPRNLVETAIDKKKLRERVFSKIIPEAYLNAVREQKVKPIANPKIQIISTEDNKDWLFKAITCETPTVDLGDYRSKIDALYAKDKIWVPGKEEKKPDDQGQRKENYLQKVIDILLKTAKVEVPDMLVEDGVNRLLANLLDQTQKLGLTVEQYLTARNITPEQIRAQYWQQAQTTLALEFILQKVAEKEKIAVDDKEIDALIDKTSDPKEKDSLRGQIHYLSAILLRQKTLDALVKPIT